MTIDREIDFLESQPLTSGGEWLSEQNQLLTEILRTLKRSRPSQRAVTDVQMTNGANVLNTYQDRATVRFLNSGKPVKSLYTIVRNSSTQNIGVAVNESLTTDGASTTGYFLGNRTSAYGWLILPTEIEFLTIAVISGAGGLGIPVNNSNDAGFSAANGCITVYGWTVPFDAYS